MDEPHAKTAADPGRTLRAKEVLAEVLRLMGASATVEAKEEARSILLAVTPGPGAAGFGFESGQRTALLDALQVVVARAVNRGSDDRKLVAIDVGGFRQQQDDDPALVEMARQLAEKAKLIGKPLAVGPMNARDRRQVHLALAEVPGISTRSEGEGVARRLLVIPSAQK